MSWDDPVERLRAMLRERLDVERLDELERSAVATMLCAGELVKVRVDDLLALVGSARKLRSATEAVQALADHERRGAIEHGTERRAIRADAFYEAANLLEGTA